MCTDINCIRYLENSKNCCTGPRRPLPERLIMYGYFISPRLGHPCLHNVITKITLAPTLFMLASVHIRARGGGLTGPEMRKVGRSKTI